MRAETLKLDLDKEVATVKLFLNGDTFTFNVTLEVIQSFVMRGIDTTLGPKRAFVKDLPMAVKWILSNTLPEDPSFPWATDLLDTLNESLAEAAV